MITLMADNQQDEGQFAGNPYMNLEGIKAHMKIDKAMGTATLDPEYVKKALAHTAQDKMTHSGKTILTPTKEEDQVHEESKAEA